MRSENFLPPHAADRLLRALRDDPRGLPTLALVDRLGADGIAPSAALELIWRLREQGRLAMRGGYVVLAEQ